MSRQHNIITIKVDIILKFQNELNNGIEENVQLTKSLLF